ncbi:hypothetical protein [Lepagella muris]|jgi:hypothetical protein|uniref:Uncharacterized protein n=1 Tax=Lepagella muris TaxID=3032870 RepID=A0AC61RE25_9BACT|nr:hypothetical protein [Lepagella muris]ROT02997.1 hypothetical protein EEL33_18590 [Muribaculaceae bacterium Isolate-037 (Harlan)]TGY78168.1 hypothetical protein E5331_11630 [Lepagella muris]THG51727.1 hypothetical protein E5984_10455 [Bacteroidales bacterium]TKC57029.1 hypothetical protein E5359_012600 [Bacteroidales bacterium]
MKTNNIKSVAALFGLALLSSCGENAWNDKLDGFEVPPIYPDKVNSTYKITPEDYETISSLSANKSLATTDEEKSALASIAKNHCFSSEDEARKYLPAFLNSTSSPYYALNNGSSLSITYAISAPQNETINGYLSETAKGIEEYKLSEADYIAAWESDEDYINGFAPMLPAAGKIPAILKAAYPDAQEGDFIAVNYNEASENPIFGSVSGGDNEFKLSKVIKDVNVGDQLSISGIVTGISTRGFVVTDEAGSICYDKGNGFNDDAITIGAQVKVNGTVGVYNQCLQISADNSYEVVGTGEYTYPTSKAYTAEMVDAACASTENLLAEYVELPGTVTISGNYYNVVIEGATAQGSIYYAPDYIKAMLSDGLKCTLTGYFVAVSGKGKYFNILVTGVKDADGTASALATRAAVGTTATTAKNALYRFDGSKWATPSYSLILQPEDYAEMGQKYGNLSEELPETLLPIYLAKSLPYASDGDWEMVAYKYYGGGSTAYKANKFIKHEGAWTGNPVANEFTEQFNKIDGNWMFDPSMTITLPAGKNTEPSMSFYQACVNWVYENIDKPLGSDNIKSGKFYVTSYGNNEYYSGTSAYQGNVDLRPGTARSQYPAGYEGMSDEEIVENMEYRLCYEVMPGALSMLYPDAKAIEGLDVVYTINFFVYTGSTTEYTAVYKVVGPAKFEFVSCTFWEDGKSPLAK